MSKLKILIVIAASTLHGVIDSIRTITSAEISHLDDYSCTPRSCKGHSSGSVYDSIPPQVENTRAAVQKRLAKERAKKQQRARDKYINYAKRK